MYRRRRPFRFLILWVIIFFLLGASIFWVDRALHTAILKVAEIKVIQLATEAIYSSVQQEVWGHDLQYQDFIQVHKDQQGRVVFMQANTVKVSKIAAQITLVAQRSLQQLASQNLFLPVGILTGTQLLANKGPRVKVSVVPAGAVKVDVCDKFESVGINQTRHRIWLNFNTEVRIVVPTVSAQTDVVTQVLLAESIIVGEVPATFIGLGGGGLFVGGGN